ncbi:MAG: XdhC family protein [Alicyclobacillus sp.]|nr:XdhC family protein [Alicyclobacillus sp.]
MSRLDEAREVFEHMEQAWVNGDQTALLTITTVKGSAYRLPGAKMMIGHSGRMWGTLSGGCLEADLYGWATQAMDAGAARTVDYDLSENELWSLGIGCRGTLQVAIFPVTPADVYWQAVRNRIRSDGSYTLVLELPTGARLFYEGDTLVAGRVEEVPAEVRAQALDRRDNRTRAEVVVAEGRRFYVDTMRPNEHLIICGAGHDAVPVAALAQKAGFRVTVLDPRSGYNGENRFPRMEHLVVDPEQADTAPLRDSWWLIMNHLQARDEQAIALALRCEPKYVGILGPLTRTREMLDNIGATWTDGPIHAPIGLDIGAETIDEVAVSLVAELLALRTGHSGQPLNGREKIHG